MFACCCCYILRRISLVMQKKDVYSGCYFLGESEVLLLWTAGKVKIFMHIISMVCLRRWEITGSGNVYVCIFGALALFFLGRGCCIAEKRRKKVVLRRRARKD